MLCTPAGILPFHLVIDPSQTPAVWGIWVANEHPAGLPPSNARVEIRWPPHFTLQRLPDAAVLDPSGAIVGRNGDLVEDAGGSGSDGQITICSLHGQDYSLEP